MPEEQDLGPVRLKFGTYENAKKLIGAKGTERKAAHPVNAAMIDMYNAAAENPCPAYSDEEWARDRFGGLLCPPSAVGTFTRGLMWQPGGVKEAPGISSEITLPGDTVINVATETEFLRPVIVGDHLSTQDSVVDISPEKKTRLGEGHFITTVTTITNQRGEVVATNKNTLYRYKAGTGS